MRKKSWVVLGRLASIVLDRPRGGKRSILVREAELAQHLGLSRGTLRNYRNAEFLVRSIPDPALRRALYRLTAAGAAQMARWLQRDTQAAMTFLLERPIAGPREIIAAEHATLSSVRPSGWRRLGSIDQATAKFGALSAPLRWDVGQALQGLPVFRRHDRPALMIKGMVSPKDDLARFYRIDRLIPIIDRREREPASIQNWSDSQSAMAAILEIPRYGLLEQYGAEARAIWSRAVSAAVAYPLVLVLFPGPASRRRFLAALPAELLNGLVPQKDRSGKLAAPVFLPAECLGGIIVTSRLNALRDIAGEAVWR